MMRIGTVGRLGATQAAAPSHAAESRSRAKAPPDRALVVLEGGRRIDPGPGTGLRDGRPSAGFVAQLIVAGDPSLRPSRLERTRAAAASYAEAARRLA